MGHSGRSQRLGHRARRRRAGPGARRARVLRWHPTEAASSTPVLGLVRRRIVGTTARDVAEVLDAIEAAGSHCVVAGGWGVDALVGRQRRRHADLDLAVDDGSPDVTASAIAALSRAGFGLVRADSASGAFLAERRLYEDRRGRLVDLHPAYLGGGDDRREPGILRLDETALVSGRIGRRSVTCLSVQSQLDAYGRHPVRDTERDDLHVLQGLRTDGGDPSAVG